MAAIVTLPQGPNTGLQTLGSALYGAASDYVAQRQANEREQRLRAQRLEDVASERDFANRTYQRTRDDRLMEKEQDRKNRLVDMQAQTQLAMVNELVRLGYLGFADIQDPQKLQDAFARAAADGTAKRYEGALQSGDLTWDDLRSGNAARIDAGLQKWSVRAGEKTSLGEQSIRDAEALIAQKEAQIADAMSRSSALEAILGAPAPKVDEAEVQRLAEGLAKGSIPQVGMLKSLFFGQRKITKPEEVEAIKPQVREQLANAAAMSWKQAREDAIVQKSLIADQLRNLSAEVNTLRNKFGVVGRPSGTPTAPSNLEDVSQPFTPQIAAAPAQAPTLETARQNALAEFAPTKPAAAAPVAAPVAPPAAPASAPVAPPSPSVTQTSARITEPTYADFGMPATREFKPISSPRGTSFPRFLLNEGENLIRGAGAVGSDIFYNLGALSQRSSDVDATLRAKEDEILIRAPDSYEAFLIRRKRNLPQPGQELGVPQNQRRLLEPMNTATESASPSAMSRLGGEY